MTYPAERRRPGSRLLLAAALVCGLVAAFVVGAGAGSLAADLFGASAAVRALLEVAGVVIVLPAGFYVVERFFLVRSARRAGGGPGR